MRARHFFEPPESDSDDERERERERERSTPFRPSPTRSPARALAAKRSARTVDSEDDDAEFSSEDRVAPRLSLRPRSPLAPLVPLRARPIVPTRAPTRLRAKRPFVDRPARRPSRLDAGPSPRWVARMTPDDAWPMPTEVFPWSLPLPTTPASPRPAPAPAAAARSEVDDAKQSERDQAKRRVDAAAEEARAKETVEKKRLQREQEQTKLENEQEKERKQKEEKERKQKEEKKRIGSVVANHVTPGDYKETHRLANEHLAGLAGPATRATSNLARVNFESKQKPTHSFGPTHTGTQAEQYVDMSSWPAQHPTPVTSAPIPASAPAVPNSTDFVFELSEGPNKTEQEAIDSLVQAWEAVAAKIYVPANSQYTYVLLTTNSTALLRKLFASQFNSSEKRPPILPLDAARLYVQNELTLASPPQDSSNDEKITLPLRRARFYLSIFIHLAESASAEEKKNDALSSQYKHRLNNALLRLSIRLADLDEAKFAGIKAIRFWVALIQKARAFGDKQSADDIHNVLVQLRDVFAGDVVLAADRKELAEQRLAAFGFYQSLLYDLDTKKRTLNQIRTTLHTHQHTLVDADDVYAETVLLDQYLQEAAVSQAIQKLQDRSKAFTGIYSRLEDALVPRTVLLQPSKSALATNIMAAIQKKHNLPTTTLDDVKPGDTVVVIQEEPLENWYSVPSNLNDAKDATMPQGQVSAAARDLLRRVRWKNAGGFIIYVIGKNDSFMNLSNAWNTLANKTVVLDLKVDNAGKVASTEDMKTRIDELLILEPFQRLGGWTETWTTRLAQARARFPNGMDW